MLSMLDHSRENTRLDRGEFIDMRALSYDSRFNILAMELANRLFGMTSRNLVVMAYTK